MLWGKLSPPQIHAKNTKGSYKSRFLSIKTLCFSQNKWHYSSDFGICFDEYCSLPNSQFFWNWCNGNGNPWQPRPNRKTQPFCVKGFRLVPNGHTLAGFAIGDLCLATIAFWRLVAIVANEGRQWRNLLGCDHWVLAGTPWPKTVEFCELGGVVIAPVLKKMAFKRLFNVAFGEKVLSFHKSRGY